MVLYELTHLSIICLLCYLVQLPVHSKDKSEREVILLKKLLPDNIYHLGAKQRDSYELVAM